MFNKQLFDTSTERTEICTSDGFILPSHYDIQSWYSYATQAGVASLLQSKYPTMDSESLARNFEDFIIFYQGVTSSFELKNPLDSIFRSVVILIKAQTGKSLCYNIHNYAVPILANAKSTTDGYVIDFLACVKKHFSTRSSHDIQSFEETVDNVRKPFDTFETFKDTIMYKKLYKLCLYLLTNNMFSQVGITLDTLGYSSMESRVMEKKFYMGPDFLYTMFDTCTFILKKGYQIYKTQDPQCIFHSGDTYIEIFEMYTTLKKQATQLHNPELFGFKASSFYRELDHIIEQAENINKHTFNMSNYDKNRVRNMISELWLIKTGLVTKRAARQTRKCPFSLLVYGETGIGKSYIKDLLFNHYGKLKGLDVSKDFIHTRNPASEFWDGFQTYQWCLVMDDIAFMHPNKCPTGDKTNLEFIQVINNLPFCPNQADLADKGKTPFQGEFVIGTTNTEHLNAAYYFSHPSAIQRRFPYIVEPILKPEYMDENGMLNGAKLDFTPGQYTDAWTFNIKTVIPVSIKGRTRSPTISTVHENLTLRQFLSWMSCAVEEFDVKQDKMIQSVNTMVSIENCELCRLPEYMCNCPSLQVESMDVLTLSFFMVCLNLCTTIIFVLVFYSYLVHRIQIIPWRVRNYFRCLRRQFLATYFPQRFDYWRDLGNQVQTNIGLPVLFVSLLAISVSIYSLVRLRHGPKIQNYDSTDVGSTPIKQEGEKSKNTWYQDDYVLSHFDISRASASQNGRSFSDFTKIVGKQCVSITVSLPMSAGVRHGKAFCLKGNIYLTNNHIIPEITERTRLGIFTQSSKEGVNENFECKLTESQIVRYPERDMCLLFIRSIPPKKGIYSYVASKEVAGRYRGAMVYRCLDGKLNTISIPMLQKSRNATISQLGITTDVWQGHAATPTNDGDCGSIVLVDTPRGKCIVGMHVAGHRGSVVSLAITSETTDSFLQQFPQFACASEPPDLSTPGYETPITLLHPKSTLRYIESGVAEVYGSFVGFRPQPKSRVEHTPMNEHLVPFGYKTRFGKPDMKSWRPWRIAMLDLVNPIADIDSDHLDHIASTFEDEILSLLTPDKFDMLGVLDNFTTINGAAGIAYLDKIPRKTSAGFPFRKSKHYFLSPDEPIGGITDPVKFDPIIMDRVDGICEHYLQGNRASPVFTAHLKDEAVSFAKMESGKTRVFAGAPVDFSLVVRKYLLNFVRLVQNNKMIFESAPGLVAQSIEWHNLGEHLTQFGSSRMIAGDYRKFDKTMSPLFTMRAFDIVVSICIKSGKYTAADITIIRGIAVDICYPILDYNGDLIQLYGSNPSGHPLTVILNGLVNSLYMRYAYYKLAPVGAGAFKSNVALMTYGDDNVAGVSEDAPWYNHTSVSSELRKIGIDYTMADKEAKSIPYIPMSQVSFLKRTWRWDDDLNCHLAPLDHTSIEKQLMVWVRSKSVGWEDQAISSISTAVREYFFYGKTVYNKRKSILMDLVETLDIQLWVCDSTFLTWEQLAKEFEENSLVVDSAPQNAFLKELRVKETTGTLCPADLNSAIQGGLISPSVLNLISKVNTKAGSPSKHAKACVMPNDTQQSDGFALDSHTQCVAALTRAISNCKRAKKLLNARKIDLSKDNVVIVNEIDYDIQSLDVTSDQNEQQENVGFGEAYIGQIESVPQAPPSFSIDSSNNVELGEFLSRPVLIKTITWTEGTDLNDNVFPWKAYFEDPAIKRKLDNYFLLRCKLRIKVVINASPFYYGCGLVSYRPMLAFQPAILGSGIGFGNITLVGRSQRPNICIYPQNSQGGELELPFLYHKNWLDATSRQDLEDIGIINFDSYVPLQNANSVVGLGVTIQVYAWAKDVEILGPTIDLAVQSRDEYSTNGVVSEPCSALARFAGYLSNIPMIAPFATATNIMATAIGATAKLFGYTNVPVIADVHAFKSQPFPQFANAHIGTPVEKLVVDPKNELSVDPRVAGVDTKDELMISSIVSRESFLYPALWSAADPADTLIFSSSINPGFVLDQPLTSQSAMQYLPMGIPNMMFKQWRGDIIFRFKFICSQYHRGRVKIAWDPTGDISTELETTSRVFTKIVDISTENDVEFIVPYIQATAYLDTQKENTRFGNSAIVANSDTDNGMLTVRILTQLTSPVAFADANVLVFVRGSENLEFANPRQFEPDLSPYVVQSKDVFDEPIRDTLALEPSNVSDSLNLIYMGEKVSSLRELMRRDCYVFTLSDTSVTTFSNVFATFKIARLPLFPGYDVAGYAFASSKLGAGTEPYNYVHWTPINWVTQCFVGQRGSIHWHANPYFANETEIHDAFVYRQTQNPLTSAGYKFLNVSSAVADQDVFYSNNIYRSNLTSGASQTNPKAQPSLAISAPMYSKFKILPTSPGERTLGTTAFGTKTDGLQFQINYISKTSPGQTDRVSMDFYCSIGTDFNPVMFLNVPTLYKYAIPAP